MRLVINIILYIVSKIFFLILMIPNIIHSIIDIIRYDNSKKRAEYYFLNSAVSIDIMCNSVFSPFLNAYFLQRGGYYFGNSGETVSSALGKNESLGKLTWIGKGLVYLLNLLQKDHCYLAIPKNEKEIYLKKEPLKLKNSFWGILFIFLYLITLILIL